MFHNLTKYQRGGIIAFIILALSVSYALYKSDTSSTKSDDATAKVAALAVANEQNRYENCVQANKAIDKLNVVAGATKDILSIAQKIPSAIESGRSVEYAEIAKKLTDSQKLNCIEPKSPTGSVGATSSTP